MISASGKCSSRSFPALLVNEVHVWSAALVTESVDLACLEQTLAPEERARAARFHSLKERNRFVVCRSLLREILGRYLGRNPGDLRFANGLYGKPFLLDAAGPPEIRFNMTRSRDLALLAFARNREVGIDVEWINPDFADLQVAELFFSPREFSALCATPASLQVGAFFDCWTRKEAYVKACGEGLFKGLGSFDVLQASGEPTALLSNGG